MSSRLRQRLTGSIAIIAILFVSAIAAYAESINYVYDDLNRLIRVVYENRGIINYSYDEVGNRLEEIIQEPDTTPPIGTITINSGAASTNSTSVTLTLTCSDLQGCSQMQFSHYDINNFYSTAEAYTDTKSWILIPSEGTKTVFVKFKDTHGNWSNAYSDTIFLDTTAPSGTITINSGAAFTSNTNVILSLTCNDAWGCSHMQFSNNGGTYSSAEAYSATQAWNLSFGDDEKIVYVKFKDTSGNWSAAYSDRIRLDATAPTTTANPTGGAYNSAKSVTLRCSDESGSDCDKIYYTTDSSVPTISSSIYTAPINISVTTTLKYFARDRAGNSESVKTQVYIIDNSPPTGTITINSNAAFTTRPSVTLTLTCSDAQGCSQMMFSNNNVSYSSAVAYSTTKAWNLSFGNGDKTVYVKFKDTLGNWSTAYSDTILLDATAPTTTANPTGGAYNSAQSVTLGCSDGSGSGCDKIYYTTDGSVPTTSSSIYTAPINISGTTTLKFFARDLAGNSESVKTQVYTIVN